MQFKIWIIILGVFAIHNFFDFARENYQEFTSEPQKLTQKDNSKKAEQVSTQAKKVGPRKIPEGFSQYAWGTPRAQLPAMELNNQMDDNRSLYKFKTAAIGLAPEYLGSNKPAAAYAAFLDDKLSYAIFQFRASTAKNVLKYLTDTYGKPQKKVQPEHTSHRWEGGKTVLIFIEYKKENSYPVLQIVDKNYFTKKN